jgi:septum site-determining protein MinC
MTLLRGRGLGLEVMLAERDFDGALVELEARLAERPDFYRGSPATVAFGTTLPTLDQLNALRAVLVEAGVTLSAIAGAPELEAIAADAGLTYVAQTVAHEELLRRRALRPKRELKLSDAARSLVADFAGARADIAERRRRGEASVPRVTPGSPAGTAATKEAPPAAVDHVPGTLYHVGTLRGGQALHHDGNIVVVGDVNPGTELVATGDIVIFGRLRGVAHAGAQGDAAARVYALDLDATQLRIATSIAADEGKRKGAAEPEVAFVRDGRIVIVPFEKLEALSALEHPTRGGNKH